jgi:hypothetical protein
VCCFGIIGFEVELRTELCCSVLMKKGKRHFEHGARLTIEGAEPRSSELLYKYWLGLK